MNDDKLEKLIAERRAQVLSAPKRTFARIADEIDAISIRLHELNVESETLLWATHPDRYDGARPVLRVLGEDIPTMLEEVVSLLREVPSTKEPWEIPTAPNPGGDGEDR